MNNPQYVPDGFSCYAYISVENSEIDEYGDEYISSEYKLGNNNLVVNYVMEDDSGSSKNFSESFSVEGVKAKEVESIETVNGPNQQEFLMGLDDNAIYEGVTVKLNYTDGSSDVCVCDSRGNFDLPSKLFDGWMSIKETSLKEGTNEITIVYEDGYGPELTTTFSVNAYRYIAKDENTDTDEKINTTIEEDGDSILNANNELWINLSDYSDDREVNYVKKTGVKGVYNRFYFNTSGQCVLLDKNGNVEKTYNNVKRFDAGGMLFDNGDLYTLYNEKIASDVKKWDNSLILKNDGRVQVFDPIEERYVSGAENIVDLEYNCLLDANGNLFKAIFSWDEASETGVYCYAKKFATNVDKIIDYFTYIGKDGKTYSFEPSEENGQPKVVFDKEAVAFKDFYVEHQDETEDDYYERYYTIYVDASHNMYLYSYTDTKIIKQLPGKYESFTDTGYKTADGKFYDNEGNITTTLKESDNFKLDTNNVLYRKGTKILDHVTDFYCYSEPVVITREDGTTWLFDEYKHDDRLRLSPPQKLTEELMASLYDKNKTFISGLDITVSDAEYTGSALTPAVTVKDGSKTLNNGTDYTVEYKDNVELGTGRAIITGKGSYTGSTTKKFKITPADISKFTVEVKDQTYTGSALKPAVTVKNGSKVLKNGTDYTVAYANNVNVGTAKVTITGKGNYTGTVSKNFAITKPQSKTNVSKLTVTVGNKTYTGKALTPAVTVKHGSKTLKNGTDYTLKYSNNVNAGKGTVTITGKGNYTGSRTESFTIYKVNVSKLTIKVSNKTYTGKALKPAVTVKYGSKTLKNGTDYTVTYKNNIKPGTGKATIKCKGNYTGSVTKNFTIYKAKQTISGYSKYNKVYGSKSFSLNAKAKGKLSYKTSNTKIATVSSKGKVTIKGTGQVKITVKAASTSTYASASKTVTINVAPKKMAAPTVKAAKKKMTISWKKDTRATGYQIVYAQNSKFTKGKKTVTATAKTTKKTITKLTSKKTYYVKIRAYKTVGKTKLYGSYSSVKKIKIK